MRDLFRQRSFGLLTATQVLTVFNDNAFKQVVLLLALDRALAGDQTLGGDPQALAGFVFAAPFLVFAVLAGDLADRCSKRNVIVATKWAEAGVMLLASVALYLQDLKFGLAALFLMGVQSAFLGPAKYGMLPELFPDKRLARANGVFQLSVYTSIILGTAVSGALKTSLGERLWLAPLGFAAVAVAGAFLAQGMHAVPAADPSRRIRFNVVSRLIEELRYSARTPGLLRAMTGHALFNLVGAALLFAWNEMGKVLLAAEVDEAIWTFGLAGVSLSMGAGCLLAGRLSRERLRCEWIALGGLLLAGALLAVGLGPRDPWFALGAMLAGGFFSGIYVVPLKTLVQGLPKGADKGRAMGASQMLDWTFILMASGLKAGATRVGLDAAQVFIVLAVVMAASALGMLPLGRLVSQAKTSA